MSTDPVPSPWLEAHPYLAPVARLHALLEQAADAIPRRSIESAYRAPVATDDERDVPLLLRSRIPLDRAAAGDLLLALAERLAGAALPPELASAVPVLRDHLRADPAARPRILSWVLEGGDLELAAVEPGVVRLLGWTLLRRILAPALPVLALAPEDDRPPPPDCPTCGASPVLAQLVFQEGFGQRQLCCGPCGTRWAYARLGCPFCGNDDPETLEALEIEGEPRLRLDTCSACHGYLKTYVGQGEEALFLSDWASLHLDVLARERGLLRRGDSLYDL
jgi:FdhE protein